jgi:Zn-finger nucleic acid-binding protein
VLEYPDITIYIERLQAFVCGQRLEQIRFASPFFLRTTQPSIKTVHGRYRKPCPVCGTSVQRIRYAANETNYCPKCQTNGKLLADRALSRLLKKDWPRTLEELEARKQQFSANIDGNILNQDS